MICIRKLFFAAGAAALAAGAYSYRDCSGTYYRKISLAFHHHIRTLMVTTPRRLDHSLDDCLHRLSYSYVAN